MFDIIIQGRYLVLHGRWIRLKIHVFVMHHISEVALLLWEQQLSSNVGRMGKPRERRGTAFYFIHFIFKYFA